MFDKITSFSLQAEPSIVTLVRYVAFAVSALDVKSFSETSNANISTVAGLSQL